MKFKVKDPEVLLPRRATSGSAGYDFYAPEDIVIQAHDSVRFKTGVYSQIDPGFVLLLFPRSSLGMKGIRIANTVGVIDSDFDQEIQCKLVNDSDDKIEIKKDERYAQGLIIPYCIVDNDEPINQTRSGGMGSTGK